MKLEAMNESMAIFSGHLDEYHNSQMSFLRDCLELRSMDKLLQFLCDSDGQNYILCLTYLAEQVSFHWEKSEHLTTVYKCLKRRDGEVKLDAARLNLSKDKPLSPFDGVLKGNLKRTIKRYNIKYLEFESLEEYTSSNRYHYLFLQDFKDFIDRLSFASLLAGLVGGSRIDLDKLPKQAQMFFRKPEDGSLLTVSKNAYLTVGGLCYLLKTDEENLPSALRAVCVDFAPIVESRVPITTALEYTFRAREAHFHNASIVPGIYFDDDGLLHFGYESHPVINLKYQLFMFYIQLVKEQRIRFCGECGRPYIFTKHGKDEKSRTWCSDACRKAAFRNKQGGVAGGED